MKKIWAVILSIGMLFSLAACGTNSDQTENGGQTETATKEITKEAYETMTAEELLQNIDIKDMKNVTAEEYAEILQTLQFVNIRENLELEKSITDEALKIIKNNAEKVPKVADWVQILLESDVPQVKGTALANAWPVYGEVPELLDEVKEGLKTEENPFVIYCTLRSFPERAFEDESIVAFIQGLTNHENARLREYAGSLLKDLEK